MPSFLITNVFKLGPVVISLLDLFAATSQHLLKWLQIYYDQ